MTSHTNDNSGLPIVYSDDNKYSCSNTAQAMVELHGELKKTHSFWGEIRLTRMSGSDYVFIPKFIYTALGKNHSIERFISELCTAFDLDTFRLQLICCCNELSEKWQYGKTILEWEGHKISNSHLESISQNAKYHDYIESMFQSSSALTPHTEH